MLSIRIHLLGTVFQILLYQAEALRYEGVRLVATFKTTPYAAQLCPTHSSPSSPSPQKNAQQDRTASRCLCQITRAT